MRNVQMINRLCIKIMRDPLSKVKVPSTGRSRRETMTAAASEFVLLERERERERGTT